MSLKCKYKRLIKASFSLFLCRLGCRPLQWSAVTGNLLKTPLHRVPALQYPDLWLVAVTKKLPEFCEASVCPIPRNLNSDDCILHERWSKKCPMSNVHNTSTQRIYCYKAKPLLRKLYVQKVDWWVLARVLATSIMAFSSIFVSFSHEPD